MKTNNVFDTTLDAILRNPIVVSYGGSSSGKTVSYLQSLFLLARAKKNLQIYCFAKTVPKLRTTLYDDMQRYVCGLDFWINNFSKGENALIFNNGSKIIFMPADDPDKFVGVRSDYILFDEINTYRKGEEIFKNLFARCRHTVGVTFNPSEKFWIADYMGMTEAKVIHSTYKNNQFAPEKTVRNLKLLSEKNENFKRIYMLGEWGLLEGSMFPQFMTYSNGIDLSESRTRFAYIDTADKGSDFYSMPILEIIEDKPHLIDVFFSQKPFSYTEPKTIELINKYKLDTVIIETNKEGSLYVNNIRKETKANIIGKRNSTNKHTRITTQSSWILDNVYVQPPSMRTEMYHAFIEQCSSYSQAIEENKNKHDDAPDSLAGAAKYCRVRLGL
jgi:PBSX family phage terminase large subunit